MTVVERFYRFQEFGRELVYDTEGVRAFVLDDVESALFDALEGGCTLEESARRLEAFSGYSQEEVRDGVECLEKRGILAPAEAGNQERSRTYALTLNVTDACNLRCKYCYVKKSSRPVPMPEETAWKAVDMLLGFEELEKLGIAFYGGEPLLNFPVVRSTMEYASGEARRRGIGEVEYHITTNGTLLTDEAITFLKDYRANIMVSIDGPDAVHDGMRVTLAGEGTHALVAERLGKLLATEGDHRVSASGVVTNRSRLLEAYEYLSGLNLRDIKLSYVRYIGESEYGLGPESRAQYLSDMRDLAQACTALLLRGRRPPYYNFENRILHLWRGTKREQFCPAGVTRFGVSPSGDVYPCGPAAAMDTWRLGGVEDGLEEEATEAWRQHTRFERRELCRVCWARYLCAGGCPLQLVRSFDEDLCEINQHATRLAIAIYATVKEQNEMMLGALVDEALVAYLDRLIRQEIC